MQQNKTALRAQLRKNRQALDANTHQTLSATICKKCISHTAFQKSQRIACYLANDGEVSTDPLIEAIWQSGKTGYLPVIDSKTRTLSFAPYTKKCAMQKNKYGILEPVDTAIHAEEIDLIIAPLVGFDTENYRLGMGGGFYDTTLASCQHKKPYFAGLAFQCQAVDTLPTEPHDQKLNAIFSA